MVTLYNLTLFISTFVFAFIGTGGAYWVLRHYGIMDVPVERSNHTVPVPRGGGLGIVLALVCFLLVSAAPGPVITSVLVLAGISFWDDLKGIHPKWRFGAQVLAVLWVMTRVYDGGRILPDMVPYALEWGLLSLAFLWFINLFNFMDGSDGLAVSQSATIGLGCVVLSISLTLPGDVWLIGIVTVGASLGFALWNWHPAKIFMGDVGSIPLGFLLGYALLEIAGAGYWQAALILPAYFVADATLTLLTRLSRRENILQAHSKHAYQRAIRLGHTHDAVARQVLALNIVFIVLAVASTINPLWGWGALLLAYSLALLQMLSFMRRKTEILPPEGSAA